MELAIALGAHRELEVALRVVGPREVDAEPAELERALRDGGGPRGVELGELVARAGEPGVRIARRRAGERGGDPRGERQRVGLTELALEQRNALCEQPILLIRVVGDQRQPLERGAELDRAGARDVAGGLDRGLVLAPRARRIAGRDRDAAEVVVEQRLREPPVGR